MRSQRMVSRIGVLEDDIEDLKMVDDEAERSISSLYSRILAQCQF